MGLHLTAAKVHRLEYGETKAFNYQIEAIKRLLMDWAHTFWSSEDSKQMQIERVDLLDVASITGSLSDEDFAKYRFDTKYDQKYVSAMLRKLADESDQSDSTVYLYWI